MGVPTNFPESPYEISDPESRWTPDQDYLRRGETNPLPPLVRKSRKAVKEWRDSGYKGATDTSLALLRWWFAEEKYNEGMDAPLNYYFAQREAVETVIWLVDVFGFKNKVDLLKLDETGELAEKDFYEHWRRLVIKMATGSGKTKVMSLLLAWSFFHKTYEEGSSLSRNFLLIAPNIIVLDRLKTDFEGLRIFSQDAVIPPNGFEGRNWGYDFQLTVHLQDEVGAISSTGNLFVTNIHRVYLSDVVVPTAEDNPEEYFLGAKPKDAKKDRTDLGEIVRGVDELMVINDEAHHIHNEKLSWFKSIGDIHNRLRQKDKELALQLDLTATPKHNKGGTFVQIVADYPLVEAIHQNIVKHPVLPNRKSREKLKEAKSAKFTEQYADYINLGVAEWRKAYEYHKELGKKAVLFIMTDDTKNCDEVAEYLKTNFKEFGDSDSVLVIHTKNNGEIAETGKGAVELANLRKQANEIDNLDNPHKAVISVLMLKEGWDVKNVTTIVGLRPYSAKSKILPEQTLGRGLRLMYPRERKPAERVSVIGTDAFIDFVDEIRKEGVELKEVPMGVDSDDKEEMVTVGIDKNKKGAELEKLNIKIPILNSRFHIASEKLETLNAKDLEGKNFVIENIKPDTKERKITFKYMLGDDKQSHETILYDPATGNFQTLLEWFVKRIMRKLNLRRIGYNHIYRIVKDYTTEHLFGTKVDLADDNVVRNLAKDEVSHRVIEDLAEQIKKAITTQRQTVEQRNYIYLDGMRPFRSEHTQYYIPQKSIQNKIPYGKGLGLEVAFASFLDKCVDVISYGKFYHSVGFYLDYMNAEGSIANYYPDFVVKTSANQIYIVETKGMEEVNTTPKMERLKQWCEDVNSLGTDISADFVFVDQKSFEASPPKNFTALTKTFTRYH